MNKGGFKLKVFIYYENEKKDKTCLELSLVKFRPITKVSTKVVMYSTCGTQIVHLMNDLNNQNRDGIISAFENDNNLELILNDKNIITGIAGSNQKCLPVEICK